MEYSIFFVFRFLPVLLWLVVKKCRFNVSWKFTHKFLALLTKQGPQFTHKALDCLLALIINSQGPWFTWIIATMFNILWILGSFTVDGCERILQYCKDFQYSLSFGQFYCGFYCGGWWETGNLLAQPKASPPAPGASPQIWNHFQCSQRLKINNHNCKLEEK